jgi:L-fuculose-phosphate aldolase
MTLIDKRAAIVAAAQELDRLGLNQGSAGNISLRHDDGLLLTPSGVPALRLAAGDIAFMSLHGADGAYEGPLPPSSEWRFHRDILRAREDVNAIVHTHSPYATVLTTLRRDLPAIHYMIAAFETATIRCTEYAPFGTEELSELAVVGLGRAQGVLLGSHGAIVTGADLGRALWRAGEIESLSRSYYLARLAGEPTILSDAEINATIARFKNYGPRDKG